MAEVESALTLWLNADEVLVVKSLSPPKTAVMEWLPTESAEVEKVAIPDPFNTPVPRVVAPSMKVTDLVAVPAPGVFAVTVAVNVMDWPKTDGLAEEASADVESS